MLSKDQFDKLSIAEKANYLKGIKSIKGRDDLMYLTRELLGYKEVDKDVHGKLVTLLGSKSRRKLILLPRGSFKSSIATISFSAFKLLNNPNLRILIDSEVLDNSERFVGQVRKHFEDPKFTAIYGELVDKGARVTSREFTLKSRTDTRLKEPSMYATGIGNVNIGQHYDLIIADDLHSEKNVSTKEQIDKVISHYRLLLSLLEPDGTLIIIGTRWDFYDLYSFILEEEVADAESTWEVYIESAVRQDGTLFFPNRLTKEFLGEQRRAQGGYVFSCQYLNSPVDAEHQKFKHEYFQYWGDDGALCPTVDGNRVLLNIYILIDRAFSSQTSADFTGCICVGVSSAANVYILEAERHKFGLNELADLVYRWTQKYGMDRVKYVGIETINWEEVEVHFKEFMSKKKQFFNLVRLSPDSRRGKADRIESALEPLYSNKRVFHRKRMKDLEDELMRFPASRVHDDLIDALAYIKQVMRVPMMQESYGFEKQYRPSGKFGRVKY